MVNQTIFETQEDMEKDQKMIEDLDKFIASLIL